MKIIRLEKSKRRSYILKKNLVFVVNYFYPDLASTGQLMTDLCKSLENDFNITVIAAQPNYAGENKGGKNRFELDYFGNIKVIRINLPKVNKNSKISRVKYIFSYFFYALYSLLKQKVNIIFTISQPPILGGLIGTIGKMFKRSKHVYNIQDFNPEQAEAISYSNVKAIYKIARLIDNVNCRYSDHVVLVGNDMVETLKIRFKGKNIPDYSVINNWTNEDEIVPLESTNEELIKFRKLHNITNKFVVMYSGNLGLYYDLENIINISNEFKDNKEILFLFIGEGAMKQSMIDYVNEKNLDNVLFLPYQDKDYIKYSLNIADIHLVVNQKGIKGVSVPSKIYGVFAAGKPVLGVLEKGSEAERLISDSKSGFVVDPGDYSGIKKLIQKYFSMTEDERVKLGINGREYLDRNLTKDLSVKNYKDIFNSL